MKETSGERLLSTGLLALAVLWYGFWLTHGHFDFLRQGDGVNLTFNSMLEHLLRGEFDVDPSTVLDEGFPRGGRTYAYWGIFCAMIRWPLLLVPGGLSIDVTILSCYLAVCLAAIVKLQTLRLVYVASERSPMRETLYWCLVLTVLFGGPQIEFLRPSIYQEVCLWAGTLAAIFVNFAVAGIITGRFTTASLCAMALAAGLALLARVSMGIGLYASLGLLLLSTLLRGDGLRAERSIANTTVFERGLLSRQVLLPVLILLGFALIVAHVNNQRWGSPLIFADFNLHIMNAYYPDRLPRTEAYGLFNLSRVPFGFVYFFFPIWVLRRDEVHLFFEDHQRRLFDAAELPPSSFFLTDPLLMLLLTFAFWSLLSPHRSVGVNRLSTFAISGGLSVAWLLMLTSIYMSFRYRIEFYPLIEFGAFLGFFTLCKATLAAPSLARFRAWSLALTVIGIFGAHMIMILYKISEFGPVIDRLRVGVIRYYLKMLCYTFGS